MTTKQLIHDLGLRHLRMRDVERIEEALNTNDLEVMVAAVDRIVERRLHTARKAPASGVHAPARAVDHVYTAS